VLMGSLNPPDWLIAEMEPGLNLWPRDPTRPGHWVSVLWIERLFWRRCVLLVNAFCQKSPVCAAHMQMTKPSNIIVNLLSIEK